MCRVIARQEQIIETREAQLMEANEQIEELQREKAKLERELHKARHGDQEAAEQAALEEELGEDPAAREAREQALADRVGVSEADIVRGDLG